MASRLWRHGARLPQIPEACPSPRRARGGSLRLGHIVLRHDHVVVRAQVLAWHAEEHVRDAAQSWFVDAELALKPTTNGVRLVDLARLRDDDCVPRGAAPKDCRPIRCA
jgi:hypothetical protein